MEGLPQTLPHTRMKKKDPKMIGPWWIGRKIGEGTTGVVRIARHTKTGKQAAVKIMHKPAPGAFFASRTSNLAAAALAAEASAAASAATTQRSLEREVVIMKLIDHPNVMRLYDVWETPSRLFLVLEHVAGGELFDLLANGKLPPARAREIFQQIVSAVDYCHRFNVVHRDLKPENVLLDTDGNVKLADFGFAAWQPRLSGSGSGPGAGSAIHAAPVLLETSCGSPHYAAPEVITGQPYAGPPYDVWSCGVILYAMLVGRLPFDDDEWDVLSRLILHGPVHVPRDVEPSAADLIRRMLDKAPARRITVAEIMVHPWFVSAPPRAPVPPTPTTQRHTGTGTGTPLVPSSPAMDLVGPAPEELEAPLVKEKVEEGIVQNMCSLWRGADAGEIVARLTAEGACLEKRVYHLLCAYHERLRRDAGEEAETGLSQPDRQERVKKGERKSKGKKMKRDGRKDEGDVDGALNSTDEHDIPARPSAPTPRTASLAHVPDSTFRSKSTRPNSTTAAALFSPTSPLWQALGLPPLDLAHLTHVSAPLSAHRAGESDGEGGGDPDVQAFLEQVTQNIALLRGGGAVESLRRKLLAEAEGGGISAAGASRGRKRAADVFDGGAEAESPGGQVDDLEDLIRELSVSGSTDTADSSRSNASGSNESAATATPDASRRTLLSGLGLEVERGSATATPPLKLHKRGGGSGASAQAAFSFLKEGDDGGDGGKENEAPGSEAGSPPTPRLRGSSGRRDTVLGDVHSGKNANSQGRALMSALARTNTSGKGDVTSKKRVQVVEPVGRRRKGRKSDESTETYASADTTDTRTTVLSASTASSVGTATSTLKRGWLNNIPFLRAPGPVGIGSAPGSPYSYRSPQSQTGRGVGSPAMRDQPRYQLQKKIGLSLGGLNMSTAKTNASRPGSAQSKHPTVYAHPSVSARTAVNACKRLLWGLGVQVAESHGMTEGSLACAVPSSSADETEDWRMGVMGGLKGVVFRVEVRWPAGMHSGKGKGRVGVQEGRIGLVFVKEGGSGETFGLVVERVKREWTLDEAVENGDDGGRAENESHGVRGISRFTEHELLGAV